MLVVAGNETTRHTMSHLLVALAEHPGDTKLLYERAMIHERAGRSNDSIREFEALLKLRPDVKLLLQQGIADPIVRVGQTCSFATQAGFPPETQWHVPNNLTPGSFVTGTVAGCPQVWKNSARPTTTWPANRYFMAYDNLAHAYWDAMTVDFLNFVNSLAWSPTPW